MHFVNFISIRISNYWKLVILIFNFLILFIIVHKFNSVDNDDNNDSKVPCSNYMDYISQDFIVQEKSIQANVKIKTKIGFFIIATGKYVDLADQLIKSMEKYLCSEEKKKYYLINYFIFTDKIDYKPPINPLYNSTRNYLIIKQNKLGWPQDTLMRFEIILNHSKILDYSSFDYLYWLDSDMKLVDYVCEDIFGDLVGTQHPHYYSSQEKYPYEENTLSTAYVNQNYRFSQPYYVGSFYGGNSNEMIKLLETCDQNIKADFNKLNGFIALVHDESHLNKYI
jgi:hypothetical protein